MREFSDPLENLLHQKVDRRTLLRGAAAAGLGAIGAPGILAACSSSAPSTTTSSAPAVETGKLQVFEWAGYEIPDFHNAAVDCVIRLLAQ